VRQLVHPVRGGQWCVRGSGGGHMLTPRSANRANHANPPYTAYWEAVSSGLGRYRHYRLHLDMFCLAGLEDMDHFDPSGKGRGEGEEFVELGLIRQTWPVASMETVSILDFTLRSLSRLSYPSPRLDIA
jgi:hypothetical protein